MRARVALLSGLGMLCFPACTQPTATENDTRFDVAETLRDRGASVEAVGFVDNPPFSVPAMTLRVNDQLVWAFEYISPGAAAVDASRFSADATKFVAPTYASAITWVAPPHLFLRERWIVAYAGSRHEILSLLADVMGPQFAGASP